MDSGIDTATSSRVSPMSSVKKELLIDLVENEKIIHSRKTDRNIVSQKQEAWKRVTNAYNFEGLEPLRTQDQLKSAWARMKVRQVLCRRDKFIPNVAFWIEISVRKAPKHKL